MGVFAYIKNGVKHKQNQFPGAYPASRVSYNGSDVESALDELNADINKGSVSVTADGVKTYGQLLTELNALIDWSKSSIRSIFVTDTNYPLRPFYKGIIFSAITVYNQTAGITVVDIGACKCYSGTGTMTLTDRSADVPPNGTKFIYYY